jgi:ribosomal protein S18 acetylase RimI-like enzyme
LESVSSAHLRADRFFLDESAFRFLIKVRDTHFQGRYMKLSVISSWDYEEIISLWKKDPSIGLSEADTKENFNRFLRRNRNGSFKITVDGRIAGTLLCGNDGRRGYFHHLYVSPAFRKMGYGRLLVEKATAVLIYHSRLRIFL